MIPLGRHQFQLIVMHHTPPHRLMGDLAQVLLAHVCERHTLMTMSKWPVAAFDL